MKAIYSDEAPKPVGPYSQAVESGNILFLSGQVAINPKTGNVDAKTIEEQTEQVMKNLKAILSAAGSDFDHVVRCTVFLTDLSDFQAFNKMYATFFHSNPPSRTTVQAAGLLKGAKIEIDAIAIRP